MSGAVNPGATAPLPDMSEKRMRRVVDMLSDTLDDELADIVISMVPLGSDEEVTEVYTDRLVDLVLRSMLGDSDG